MGARRDQHASETTLGAFFLVPPRRWRFLESRHVRRDAERVRDFARSAGTWDGAELHVEELVRQWALRRLVDVLHLPAEWVGSRILIEEPIRFGASYRGAVDISIKRQDRRSVAFVETKARGKLRGRGRQQAIEQLESYMSAAHWAEYGIATDGDTTVFVRRHDSPRDIVEVPAFDVAGFLRDLRGATGVADAPDADETTEVTQTVVTESADGFEVGAYYTRRQIHEAVGGTLQGYLPHVGGRVVAGCFDAGLNPSVPYEVLVGDGPIIVKSARVLAAQEEAIPVFVKLDVNRWEYLGMFRSVGYSESPEDVDPRVEAAGRGALAVLSLVPAGS